MKRYLTTPIYYSGGAPHLGHVYTMRLADCARRAAVLAGADTPLVTGYGEHGQKIECTAARADLSSSSSVADRSAEFRQLWKELVIEPDFVRTTRAAHKTVMLDL